MKFSRVKGTEDFYPQDKAVQNVVFAALRSVATRYGFDEVETPALESLSLLTAKSGDEVKGQIFTLEKRGSEELGLRFDLTVPITRMFVERQRELPKPTKWFALSRMWRYERPQKGRLREFYQLSAELFGLDSPQAVAECLNMLIACLEALGLSSKDVVLRVNNRRLLQSVVRALAKGEFSFEAVVRVIDKLAKISENDFYEQLRAAGVSGGSERVLRKVLMTAGTMQQVKASLGALKMGSLDGIDELERLFDLVPNDWLMIDLSIARGLAYYTGTVFECWDRKGEFRAIAGGGQYDQLTNLLGGASCPAVGFGLGYSTLRLLLESLGRLPVPVLSPKYYIGALEPVALPVAAAVARRLRRDDRVYLDLEARKLPKHMSTAKKLGAEFFIAIGENEVASGSAMVKNLLTGAEESIKLLNET